MKRFFRALLCIGVFSLIGVSQCRETLNSLDGRQKMLDQFESVLNASIPAYAQSPGEFFVYDLTEPTNYYKSPTDSKKGYGCINFANNHIYHFSPYDFEKAESHIAFLEDGKLKVFNSINCEDGKHTLEEVVRYATEQLKNDRNREDVLLRLKNYRRYGFYFTIDSYRVGCNFDKVIPENSDALYRRGDILEQLSTILKGTVSQTVKTQFPPFFVEESRANGFFIYDLTEPSNKQTSLLERVEFKNNHIYHFAYIDKPFSFSNIAVLEDGKLKTFKALNCEGKGDNLKDVVGYLKGRLKSDKDKDEIIRRVKNYRTYGVYASFNGLSTPQCEEVIAAEK